MYSQYQEQNEQQQATTTTTTTTQKKRHSMARKAQKCPASMTLPTVLRLK